MSRLLLIRHAQASFMAEDYDQLSELGERQSDLLANYLLKNEQVFDKVYTGPLRRHAQTASFSKKLFVGRNTDWNHELLEAFNEHQGPEVVGHVMPQLMATGEVPATLYEESDHKLRQRIYFNAFQKIMRQWARQELDLNGLKVESWANFRSRVRSGLHHIMTTHPTGENVVVFTSGGAIGAALGEVLNLSDDKILELSWMVLNASITELVFSKDRLTLKSFNTTPHLMKNSLNTFI